MSLKICESLELLAEKFNSNGKKLYVVGGYVRNSLLGIGHTDIDITGALDVKTVAELCRGLGFRSQVVNKNLGTLLITTKNEQFEYTMFRAESYADDGSHIPVDVKFVEDIKVDAVKIGMLSCPETINVIYKKLLEYKPKNIVVDPVI